MIEAFEKFLAIWLGAASSVGAASWIQWFSWVAALFIALSAWISIRRQSLQSRATLLLSLYGQWELLASQRQAFNGFLRTIKHDVLQKNSTRKEKDQSLILRQRYKEEMIRMREAQAADFHGFISFISFFELIGTYVRKGYLPIRDIRLLYKGPILEMEQATRDFIRMWQDEAHMPRGLLENAMFLMLEVRAREDRPIYYHMTTRRLRQMFRHFGFESS